jgi:hypothetical protein
MNKALDLSYRYQGQYHFDPLSGWEGEKFSYELPARQTEDRTLLINPFNEFGFLEITLVPGDMDAGMIDSTEVHLHYEDPGVWSRDKVITVKPDSDAQLWRLRLTHPEQRIYTYQFSHHLKDGTQRQSLPVTTEATSIAVNDPFEDPLVVEFFPNYDATNVRILFVHITYEDAANQYKREAELRFEGATPEAQRLRLARIDPNLKQYTFQLTILGNDNSVRRGNPVETAATLIFIGEHLQF